MLIGDIHVCYFLVCWKVCWQYIFNGDDGWYFSGFLTNFNVYIWHALTYALLKFRYFTCNVSVIWFYFSSVWHQCHSFIWPWFTGFIAFEALELLVDVNNCWFIWRFWYFVYCAIEIIYLWLWTLGCQSFVIIYFIIYPYINSIGKKYFFQLVQIKVYHGPM